VETHLELENENIVFLNSMSIQEINKKIKNVCLFQ